MPETPKKLVRKRGRKPKELCVDDFVVFVNIVLNASMGKSPKLCQESRRIPYINRTLMQEIGIVLHKHLSSRVCSPCANKIRRFSELHNYIACSINSSAHMYIYLHNSQ
jgi:hypothetical protein